MAPRALRYPWGRSRVAYSGTTRNGMPRPAHSTAARAQAVLGLHGVREFEVRTCRRGLPGLRLATRRDWRGE